MMMVQLLSYVDDLRTFVVVFASGEDPITGLKQFAERERIRGAHLTALGAFERATVGYFDWQAKDYLRLPFEEQMEVLALTGNIGEKEAAAALHVHVVLGRSDGTAHGGHLLEATVRPTLEIVVTETPARLHRRFDPATGLFLQVNGARTGGGETHPHFAGEFCMRAGHEGGTAPHGETERT